MPDEHSANIEPENAQSQETESAESSAEPVKVRRRRRSRRDRLENRSRGWGRQRFANRKPFFIGVPSDDFPLVAVGPARIRKVGEFDSQVPEISRYWPTVHRLSPICLTAHLPHDWELEESWPFNASLESFIQWLSYNIHVLRNQQHWMRDFQDIWNDELRSEVGVKLDDPSFTELLENSTGAVIRNARRFVDLLNREGYCIKFCEPPGKLPPYEAATHLAGLVNDLPEPDSTAELGESEPAKHQAEEKTDSGKSIAVALIEDGPIGVDGFAFGGKSIEGLTETEMKIAKYVWAKKGHWPHGPAEWPQVTAVLVNFWEHSYGARKNLDTNNSAISKKLKPLGLKLHCAKKQVRYSELD